MKRGVVLDLETSGIDSSFSSILQGSAVCFNLDTFEEIDRFDYRGRMKKFFSCPHPKALLINHVSIDQLKNHENSNFKLVSDMQKKFLEWGECIYYGWNNIQFDRHHLRSSLYQNCLPPYLTNTNGNQEGDFLKITHAASTVYPNSFVRPLNDKGSITFQLEKFGPANNIYAEKAHDSLSDVIQTLNVGKLIKERCPDVWENSLITSSKKGVFELIDQDKIYMSSRWFRGKSYSAALAFICKNPAYENQIYFFNLKYDPELIFDLDRNELKKLFKGKNKVFEMAKANDGPLFLDEKYLYQIDEYKDFSPDELHERMMKVRSNKTFIEKFSNLLIDKEEDKNLTQDQSEKLIENRIYDGFATQKDNYLMQEFHAAVPKKKFEIANKIEDIRFNEFAKRVLFEEFPDFLPKKEYDKREKIIAENHLTLDKTPWITIPQAMQAIDDLREQEEEEIDLVKLDEIDEYLTEMQEKFENIIKK